MCHWCMQTTSQTNHVEESFVFPSLFVSGVLYIITVVYRQSTPSWEKKKEKRIKLMSFASSPIIDKCQSSLPPKESRFNSAVGLSLGDFVFENCPVSIVLHVTSQKDNGTETDGFSTRGRGTMWNSFFRVLFGDMTERHVTNNNSSITVHHSPTEHTKRYLWLLLLHGRAGTGEGR